MPAGSINATAFTSARCDREGIASSTLPPLPAPACAWPENAVDAAQAVCNLAFVPVALTYPHIVKPPGETARLERHPRTRVSMLVADYLWRGWSAEEIVRQYSYLTLAEVHSALAYYFDCPEEIEQELVAEYGEVERWKKEHPTPTFLARLKEQARR